MPALSCRRLWRLIASHESAIWSFLAGMAFISPMGVPLEGQPSPALPDGCDAAQPGSRPAPPGLTGPLQPPAGHPERLVPDAELTPTERLLWAQLSRELGR
jgi:hypothetical protein